jgi:protein TonB
LSQICDELDTHEPRRLLILRAPMFDGFRPGSGPGYFVHREVPAFLAALVLVIGPVVYAFLAEPEEEVVEVELAPEIKDFAVEEEPEEEEPEEEPPPPPPDAKVEVVKKVKPKPRPATPIQKPTDAAPETDKEKTWQVEAGAGKPGGTGFGPLKKPPPPKRETQLEKPEPVKKKPTRKPIDPTKPIDRPEKATVPKPLGGNAEPKHPEKLRDKGITGKIVIKLHIHRDGTVRGAKVLRKSSSATTNEEKKEAEKLFLAAVIKAVKTWKYKPAMLEGQPITVWHTVTIPFTLTS